MQLTKDVFSDHILEDREAKVWGRMNYDDNLIAIPFQTVKIPIVIVWVVW
jgi:hypothetical protein